jgi:hypothetical protein
VTIVFTYSIHASDTRNGADTKGTGHGGDIRAARLHHGQSWARRTSPALSALRST